MNMPGKLIIWKRQKHRQELFKQSLKMLYLNTKHRMERCENLKELTYIMQQEEPLKKPTATSTSEKPNESNPPQAETLEEWLKSLPPGGTFSARFPEK